MDGQPVTVRSASLADALAEIAARAEARGRLVVEVIADGMILNQGDLESPSVDAGRYEEVSFTTADPGALVREALMDAAGALEEAAVRQESAAGHVMAGRLDEAREALRGALETWQGVRSAVDRSAAVLGVEPGALGSGEARLDELLASLHGALGEVRGALERQDYSALADVLGYELRDLAGSWQAALRGAAGSKGGAA